MTMVKTLKTDNGVDVFEELFPLEEHQDPNAKAHIINPPNNLHLWQPGMTSKDLVELARATGQFVVALCHVTFIPKNNPGNLDACQACVDIAGKIIEEMG